MRWDDDSGELAEYDALKDLILTLLPYDVDDGEDPPNEANAEECVEYAADEIKRLRSKNAELRAEVDALRAALADIARGDYSDPLCMKTPEQRAREALTPTKGTP